MSVLKRIINRVLEFRFNGLQCQTAAIFIAAFWFDAVGASWPGFRQYVSATRKESNARPLHVDHDSL